MRFCTSAFTNVKIYNPWILHGNTIVTKVKNLLKITHFNLHTHFNFTFYKQ